MPEVPLPKPIERKSPTYEKHTDYEFRHELGPDGKQEILQEKKVITEEGGIETSSISKESSLQFFVKKIKEGESTPAAPVKEILPKVETQSQYQKFTSSSPAPKSFTEIKSVESVSTAPVIQEYKSSSFTKEVTHEHKSLPASTQQSTFKSIQKEPPTYKPFTQEYSSSFSSTQHTSEPQEYKSYSSEVIKEFGGLKPEPPAQICYPPSVSKTSQETSLTSEKKDFSEKVEKSFQSSSYQTSSSSYSRTFESTSSPVQRSWTSSTKQEVVDRPASVASSSYSTTEKQSYSRPLSSLSTSNEGVQMEKQWAHKFSPKTTQETSWSTQSTLEKKWAPVETKTQKVVQESRTFLDKTPHYVGEVTRLETTVKDQQQTSESFSSSSAIVEESNLRPSLKSWPPAAPQYVAPPPPPVKPYPTIESLPIRPVSVQDITDEVVLEPGPPPEIGYAEPPKQRRRSYVETIEQELEQEIYKEPTKVLPCAVRTIPPPLPPKKEVPLAPPVPARPQLKIKKPMKELPYVPFEKFPDLEPFPFKPDPERPKPLRTGPPPMPSKFIKGRFTDSDYESDFEAVRIAPKWKPSMSDTEEPRYRRVRAPRLVSQGRSRSQEPEPLAPSQFEQPPRFDGPPRPEVNFDEFRRKKDASQIKKMTKHFEQVRREAPPAPIEIKPASPPTYVYPEKKPDSPKAKKKVVTDGYTADTDEPFQQRILRTEHFKEERSTETKHISQSSQKIYESTSSKSSRTSKFPTKRQSSTVSTAKKVGFVCVSLFACIIDSRLACHIVWHMHD